MKLLFDLGNSRIKWGWAEGGGILRHGSFRNTEDALRQGVAAMELPDTLDQIAVSSVLHERRNRLFAEELQTRTGQTPWFAHVSAAAHGVRNGYHDPAQLGVDRWLALIAAWRITQAAVCVIDCGTTITVDWLDADGVHAGGLVIPGYRLMRDTTQRDTAQISLAAKTAEDGLPPGKDTTACVTHGCLRAIQAFLDSLPRIGGAAPSYLITGGDAARLSASLELPAQEEPLLLFQGLDLLSGKGA